MPPLHQACTQMLQPWTVIYFSPRKNGRTSIDISRRAHFDSMPARVSRRSPRSAACRSRGPSNERSRIGLIVVAAGVSSRVTSSRRARDAEDPDPPTSTPPRQPRRRPVSYPGRRLHRLLLVVDASMTASFAPPGEARRSARAPLLQSEGNPEGPMSFVRSGDDLPVLDQVNSRVVRCDKSGRSAGTFAIHTTQDINGRRTAAWSCSIVRRQACPHRRSKRQGDRELPPRPI